MGADLILFILGQMAWLLLVIFLIGMAIAGVLVVWLFSWRVVNG